jgi:hypothetical protein
VLKPARPPQAKNDLGKVGRMINIGEFDRQVAVLMLFNFDYFTKQMFEQATALGHSPPCVSRPFSFPGATLAKSELSGFNANGMSYPSVAWLFLQNAYA